MDHLALLRRVTGAFEAGVDAVPHDARLVAARWSVRDLVCHLGAVHRWAAANTTGTSRHPRVNVPSIDEPLARWYATSRRVLLDRLDAADPAARCYTLRRVGFWHRRQLHETLVHLWDLRSAADPTAPPPTEAPPTAHADCLVELFDVFAPRASPTPVPLPGVLALHATDLGTTWHARPDWTLTETAGAAEAVATVGGTAGALALFAWNRLTPADGRLAVTGAEEVVTAFTRARIRA